MTEVQFLLQMLEKFEISKELHAEVIGRLRHIETLRSEPPIIKGPLVPIEPVLPIITPIINPIQIIPTPCYHEYPTLWGGTNPPQCVKCGKLASPSPYQVTCNSNLL